MVPGVSGRPEPVLCGVAAVDRYPYYWTSPPEPDPAGGNSDSDERPRYRPNAASECRQCWARLSTLPDVVLDTPLARLLANRQEDDDDVPAFQLDPKGKGVDRSGFDIDAEGIVALQMALQTDEVVWWRTP